MVVQRTPAGLRSTQFTLTNPGVRVPNDDGGYTTPRAALDPPTAWGSIVPATPKDLENLMAGTTVSTGSYVITIPFHPQVTTKTVLAWEDRLGRAHTASVTGYSNPDQLCIETVIVAVEMVP